MKIILLQDIKGVGKRGTIKEVSDGYARNFLFPKKLAEIAVPGSIKKIEAIQQKQVEAENIIKNRFKAAAKAWHNQEVIIQAKNKDGKLFGSINIKDILIKLKESNLPIEAKNIILPHQIKEVGEYAVELDFGNNIKSNIKVIVKGE